MQANPFQKLNIPKQKTLLTFKQQILHFITTHTHIIYITQRQIQVLILSTYKPTFLVTKIDGRSVLKIQAQKNSYLAILYHNHSLQVRNANQIQKIVKKYNNVDFSENDMRNGFPKIYLKDDDLLLFNSDRIQLFGLKSNSWKFQKNNEALNKNSQAVTDLKILQTIKFETNDNHEKGVLVRQYLVLIINNALMEVYYLMNLNKILEIDYHTKSTEKILLTSDLLDNFLYVSIYDRETKKSRANILYRINQLHFHLPAASHQSKQPFFDLSIPLNLNHPINLLRLDQKVNPIPLSTPNYLTALYLNEKIQKKNKKKQKKLSKQFEIVEVSIDLNDVKVEETAYQITKAPKDWLPSSQWKQRILNFLKSRSVAYMSQIDQLEMMKESRQENKAIQDKQSTQDKSRQPRKEKYCVEDEKPSKVEQRPEKIKNEKQKYLRLKESLGNALDKLKNHEKKEEKKEQHQYVEEKNMVLELIEYMKKNGDQWQFPWDDSQIDIPISGGLSQQEEKIIKTGTVCKDQSNQGKVYRPSTEPETPKQKQNLQKAISSQNFKKLTNQLQHDDHQSFGSIPTEQIYSVNDKLLEQSCMFEDCDTDEEQQQEENQLFDTMLILIEQSIEKGFKPLEDKLSTIEQKVSAYSSKNLNQLNQYFTSVCYESNYLNNIESSIHGYCFQMKNQFSDTLQTGITKYMNKVQDLDRKSKQQRQKSIHDYGIYIDHQIRERETIIEQNKKSIENHFGHLRNTMKNQPNKRQEPENQRYLQEDDDQCELPIQALTFLALLGNKKNKK